MTRLHDLVWRSVRHYRHHWLSGWRCGHGLRSYWDGRRYRLVCP